MERRKEKRKGVERRKEEKPYCVHCYKTVALDFES